MDRTVTEVRAFVQNVHEGQADELGRPLMEHLEAVRERVAQMGGEDADQIAALLHHALSDGRVTAEQLAGFELPDRSRAIVDALTRRAEESEDDQLRRVMETPGAVRVLRADLAHQLHPDRLRCCSAAERELTLHRCCRILVELDKEPELTFR
ncbi:MAG TPA: hypothetical protein VLJ59_04565 [Mycobacteriales bacterium]|nr:hypothetical protein [Mycobacteriales bacterium]